MQACGEAGTSRLQIWRGRTTHRSPLFALMEEEWQLWRASQSYLLRRFYRQQMYGKCESGTWIQMKG